MLKFQTYFKYRFSQREMVVGGTCSRPMQPNLVDCAICNGRPPTGCPLTYQVCFPHYLIEYIKYASPPSVGFPFLPNSMQRTEVHQIFTVSPPQQILCNSIQKHWKFSSFNMFHQYYSWHRMFCCLTVFYNQAQKCEFSVIFII